MILERDHEMSYADRFNKPEDADRYLAAYEAVLALWPVAHEAIDIETSFGTTHVNVAGSPDSPPLLLLPGAQISSTIWYPNVEPLSRHFRVYAPDIVDQTGRSVPARKLTNPQENVEWLTEVLDALHLDRVPMIGHSNGCWQILNFAKAAPQRIERIVLLSPAPPFAQLRWQMLLRLLPVFISPTRRMFYWNFKWLTTTPVNADQPHPLIELFMIGAMAFKPQETSMPARTLFTDAELSQINLPILLLTGDQERVANPHRVLERARRLLPNIEAHLIPNAGHLLPVDQPTIVNEHILKFLCG
jgi:pimeloyl-ACP methyl ester carboxylesterase